jgi:hypothetical protein
MDSILSNRTWELSERPHGCKPVGCKWVFKKKLRPDGTIEKYKARLVAKGYTQREGEDYFDTYLPISRLTTIRVLLSMAASYGLIVYQMDVKTAFLNGELEEEIYMDQPDRFVVKGEERKMCKLLKSLYGLKQAHKQCHEKFDRTLTYVGFAILYGRWRIRFLGSALRDCSSFSSRVVFLPSRTVQPTAVFIAVYFDRSSPTLSSTTLLLRLHLQANGTCGLLQFVCSSCSASTYFAATYFRSSCCSMHLVCLSYMW